MVPSEVAQPSLFIFILKCAPTRSFTGDTPPVNKPRSGDGCGFSDRGVGPVVIVGVDPSGQGCEAAGF